MNVEVIGEPRVYLVAKTYIEGGYDSYLVDEGHAEYESDGRPGADVLVEFAGRNCYDSFGANRPGGNKAYINRLLECGHGSVLEHAVFSVMVAGVSRSLTHELIRHRAGMSYSQRSQRYVDESKCAFVVPPVVGGDPEFRLMWDHAIHTAQVAYKSLSNGLAKKLDEVVGIEDKTKRRKMAREAARSVMPNATETKILVTANIRAWRNFFEQRGSLDADAEIRRLAIAIFNLIKDHAPNCFGDTAVRDNDGIEYIHVGYHKV